MVKFGWCQTKMLIIWELNDILYFMKYNAKNETETIKIGNKIASELKGGDILCLYGDLGAGKTTLVKGLAKGLGIKKEVTSPTFALMNLYDVDARRDSSTSLGMTKRAKTLAHFDLYRLKSLEEFFDMGGEDYLGAPDTICVIEWPEKIDELLKTKKCVKIRIEHKNNGREIVATT
jgi:tRNA threonylcarbamoyladenosine biosynthesis protein TsaE